MRRKFPWLGLFLVLVVSPGFASEPASSGLRVLEAYVRGLPPGQKNTAAFFRLVNDTAESVTVLAGKTDVADSLEIHKHLHQNGMMRMEQQNEVVVEANGQLAFVPGGYHLMLIGLHQPLQDGERVSFTLITASGETVDVSAPVISVLRKFDH